MSPSSPMYGPLARYYDLVYGPKDYAREVRELKAIVRRFRTTPARTWLDVACGTGRHLEHLQRRFDVVGVDLSPQMLALARRRLPGVRLVRGELTRFELHRQFDVVSCLFSAIGYLPSERALRRALERLVHHLAPGGVVLIEPWVDPSRFHAGHVALDTGGDERVRFARMSEGSRRGARSTLTFHYLFGEAGRGTRYVVEREHLRLTPYRDLRHWLAETGVRTHWIRKDTPHDRGRLVGVAPPER